MAEFADVIVDISAEAVDRAFTYRVPAAYADALRLGMKVDIPFRTKTTTGYIVGFPSAPAIDPEKLKELIGPAKKGIDVEDTYMALAAWMKEAYGCTMNQALKAVLPAKKQVKKGRTRVEAVPLPEETEPVPAPALNAAQQQAVEAVYEEKQGKNRPCLLFGVTGSGKTEVYMALIERMIAEGKQTILLIPEIALTYQNLRRFYARFGSRIGVINSRQSAGEKFENIQKAAKGEVDLIIGPRSALFAPFPKLGLILIDEAHEEAYHSDMPPRYDSVHVAEKLAELTGATLVLGSATPSLESFQKAQDGTYRLLRLPARAVAAAKLPQVHIVDLRKELTEGNKSVFSRLLTEKMEERLAKKEQIMLFLNRRGFAGFVSCRSCGKAVKCPHCDVSLTYHRSGILKCHYCGFAAPFPKTCPACGSPYIAAFGTGTQKVETIVGKAFPGARVLRMDADTTAGKDGHSRILSAFSHEAADILIGTQMIVKGHDFPRVTLVGVLAADLSLYASDYRAAERTFDLLTQAAGRAGRSGIPGEVVIQTYMPEHYAVQTAARQDYESFYKEEIAFRRLLHYPPAGGLLQILFSDRDEEKNAARARAAATMASERFAKEKPVIIGPSEHAVAKLQDMYRQTLFIKHENPAVLRAIRDYLEELTGENAQFDIL